MNEGSAVDPHPEVPHGRPTLTGYVMTHEHPTYGMAFGGNYAYTGAIGNYHHGIMDNGYTEPCGGCDAFSGCDHGEVKGSLAETFKVLGRDMGAHASYGGPLHNSNSHLRYSTEWIQDAFAPVEPEFQDSRMGIMVAFAVENEAMCENLYYANQAHGDLGYPCSHGDSYASLLRQLDSIKAWALENRSWAEVAYSAADTRRIAASGKLAVILGVESEYAFGAENRGFDPVERLEEYYQQGVRTFYLAHKINSRLAGADVYASKNSPEGKTMRAIQAISGCFYYDDNIGSFPLLSGGLNHCRNESSCGPNAFRSQLGDCAYKISDISELSMANYILLKGADAFDGFAVYPQPPGFRGRGGTRMEGNVERNNLGLSIDGSRVVRRAMQLGMIVNLDHVSTLARADIYRIARNEFRNYPLNALHNNPNEMLSEDASPGFPTPNEYDFDRFERDMIRGSGGIFGVRLGPLHSKAYDASGVRATCPGTSTETAKVLASLLDEGLQLGYSLDFATVTEGVHSRTFEKCREDLGPDEIHEDGSYLAEGLSHIGMMKRWHRELETIGMKSEYIDRLKTEGSESFVRMWEISEYIGKL